MKKFLLVVGLIILIVVVGVVLFLGQIIKTGIETAGPKIAGVPMSVETVKINPLSGLVHVKALVVGNPEGFKSPSSMELGEFKLSIAISSLFTDTIVIKEILISNPEITYERKLKTSNLAELQKQLTPAEKPDKPAPADQPKAKKSPAKKVIIEDLQLNGAKVNMVVLGKVIPLPLPPFSMKDIGKNSGGASPTEVISTVFNAVFKAIGSAVSSTTGAAGDALKNVTGTASDTIKDVSGTAGDAIKNVSGAAGDAVKGVSGAAGDAAEGLKKGIGNLFGK